MAATRNVSPLLQALIDELTTRGNVATIEIHTGSLIVDDRVSVTPDAAMDGYELTRLDDIVTFRCDGCEHAADRVERLVQL